MNDTLLWTLLGHLVCIAQWAAFILVDYAYLGKNKKVRYPCIWAAVLAACVLFVSIRWDLGFFNTASIATNVVYLLLASLLFGGTPNQKLTGSLINGVMCLLTENTVSFLFAWFLGVPTGSVWRYKSCLAALVVSILAVGLLVAYFMRRWNSTCALEPLQAAVMSFFPGVVVALNHGPDGLGQPPEAHLDEHGADRRPDGGRAGAHRHRADVQRPGGAAAELPLPRPAGAAAGGSPCWIPTPLSAA